MLDAIRIESKGGFELSLEITVKAFLASYTISETPPYLEGPHCGDFPFQTLEVVTALSQVVFHGLSTQIKESGSKGRTAVGLSFASIHAETPGANQASALG